MSEKGKSSQSMPLKSKGWESLNFRVIEFTRLIKESLCSQVRNMCAMIKAKIDTWENRFPNKIPLVEKQSHQAFVSYLSQFWGGRFSQIHWCRLWGSEDLRNLPMAKQWRHGIPGYIPRWMPSPMLCILMPHEVFHRFWFPFAGLWWFSIFLKWPL